MAWYYLTEQALWGAVKQRFRNKPTAKVKRQQCRATYVSQRFVMCLADLAALCCPLLMCVCSSSHLQQLTIQLFGCSLFTQQGDTAGGELASFHWKNTVLYIWRCTFYCMLLGCSAVSWQCRLCVCVCELGVWCCNCNSPGRLSVLH